MKQHRYIQRSFFTSLLICFILNSYAQSSDSIFSRYFRYAQEFADAFPREKVHLHLDNTSYYLGDTIWFKAYVVTAEKNLLSAISKPLYVELLDQLGNVAERQIIQLTDGEGNGQFILNQTFFTGYYEVRAYTKWMLAFDNPSYFSRTLPVYRKRLSDEEAPRSIATYRMDSSMKQRPNKGKEGKLTIRFFPEGGQLVKGISSLVAFEAVSRDQGPVEIEGTITSEKADEAIPLQTLHDGLGYFMYTPGDNNTKATVSYEGRTYQFALPEAASEGYTLQIDNRPEALDITVTRSSLTLKDTLAVFVAFQGRPYKCMVLNFENELSCHFQIPVNELPGGVAQLSLVASNGGTLCERFCYLMPLSAVRLACTTNRAVYRPYELVNCRVKVRDQRNRQVKTGLSVAIRNGANSDYREYDHSIYTDLLLVSDLKGYIHQPGFYFAEQSAERRKMLDVLLLVRGWRKYDLSQSIGAQRFQPRFLPENSLALYGQVQSFFGRALPNVGVSILARRDSLSIGGITSTDSLGYFSVPVDGFSGSIPALIQTRNQGKKLNKEAVVKLFRHFEAPLRELHYEELNPDWKMMSDLEPLLTRLDSTYKDSIYGSDNHLLKEVVVNAKGMRQQLKQTESFEKEILGYYNIPQLVDKIRDEGKMVYNLPILLNKLNSSFRLDSSLGVRYKNAKVLFIVNGGVLSYGKTGFVLDKDVDAIKTITLYYDQAGGQSIYVMNKNSNRVKQMNAKEFWSGQTEDNFNNNSTEESLSTDSYQTDLDENEGQNKDDTSTSEQLKKRINSQEKEPVVVCSIITIDDWDSDKSYQTQRGIRSTYIQGYNEPLEHYSPAYPDGAPLYAEDYRRTLYWNPNVITNAKGEATIECYNSSSSAPIIINVETLYSGCPASLDFYSGENISGSMK